MSSDLNHNAETARTNDGDGVSVMRPMVYVAGPITGDPFGCVRKALPAFRALLDLGCLPFLPQLTVIAEMIEPLGYEEYLRYDFGIIRHCDALLRLPGDSPGADREIEFAKAIHVPVFYWDDADSWGDLVTMYDGIPV